MVLLDPRLKVKSRAKMGLKEFTRTEIRSHIMGIPVTITEEVIGKSCRRKVEGEFQWTLNKKDKHLDTSGETNFIQRQEGWKVR